MQGCNPTNKKNEDIWYTDLETDLIIPMFLQQ